MFSTYVLVSLKDNKFYIGSTSDLKRRIGEHNRGEVISTKSRRPFKLVFCEYFVSKKDALRREEYFKTDPGKKSLRLIVRDSYKVICNK